MNQKEKGAMQQMFESLEDMKLIKIKDKDGLMSFMNMVSKVKIKKKVKK